MYVISKNIEVDGERVPLAKKISYRAVTFGTGEENRFHRNSDLFVLHLLIVHGMWALWSSWSECSVSCGIGNQFRTRTCDNPEPANGGRSCHGEEREARTCAPIECPSKFGIIHKFI